VGVAHEAHLKKLRRIAAEVEDAVKATQVAHLQRLRRIAAAEAAQKEGVRDCSKYPLSCPAAPLLLCPGGRNLGSVS
jgi:hypothetical protein